MYQEATMPIEEIVAKYGRGEEEVDANGDIADSNGDIEATKDAESSSKKALTHPAVAELSKKGRKPISPYLRAKTVSRVGAAAESGPEQEDSEVKEEVKPESETPETKTEAVTKTESDEDS